MKTCTVCGETKPLDLFAKSKRGRDGLHTFCKVCKAAQSRAWAKTVPAERKQEQNRRKHLKNGDRRRAVARSWYQRNKARLNDLQRRWALKSKFGITLEEYDAWVEAQDGKCAICKQPPKAHQSARRKLRVDHCHATNKVRGLLCHHCNVGIGHFWDSPALLMAAADYLKPRRSTVMSG